MGYMIAQVEQTLRANYSCGVPQVPLGTASPCRQLDSLRVQSAKNLMVESSRLFLGLLGEGLVVEIQTADADHLRHVVAHWHMSLRQSGKIGVHVTDQYVSAVKILLGMGWMISKRKI